METPPDAEVAQALDDLDAVEARARVVHLVNAAVLALVLGLLLSVDALATARAASRYTDASCTVRGHLVRRVRRGMWWPELELSVDGRPDFPHYLVNAPGAFESYDRNDAATRVAAFPPGTVLACAYRDRDGRSLVLAPDRPTRGVSFTLAPMLLALAGGLFAWSRARAGSLARADRRAARPEMRGATPYREAADEALPDPNVGEAEVVASKPAYVTGTVLLAVATFVLGVSVDARANGHIVGLIFYAVGLPFLLGGAYALSRATVRVRGRTSERRVSVLGLPLWRGGLTVGPYVWPGVAPRGVADERAHLALLAEMRASAGKPSESAPPSRAAH